MIALSNIIRSLALFARAPQVGPIEAVPNPKLIFAVGSCASGGGCWFDSYSVLGGAEKVIPVDYYIPGCPPRPEAILYGVALALGLVPKNVAEERMRQETLEELAQGRSAFAQKELSP